MTVHRLGTTIQNYAWGDREALARMQGRTPGGEPEAELWIGAHSGGPSTVRRDGAPDMSLPEFLAEDPTRLPDGVDELPFLLKVLAIGGPLSIQVHPDPEQAREGFDAAERGGLPVSEPTRSYKDPYAKPEVVVALEPMRVLVGVLDSTARRALVEEHGMDWLRPLVEASPADLVRGIFALSDDDTDAALSQVRSADVPKDRAELVTELLEAYPGDRGVLVAVCMNLVHLEPGQALFTDAGVLHAYVSGLAVEIMNPSDNVLRAGLTSKHVDVDELARILRDDQSGPEPLTVETLADGGERIPLWTDRVSLRRYPGTRSDVDLEGSTIVLATEGSVTVDAGGVSHDIGAGHAVLVVDEATVSLSGGQAYLAECR